MLSSKRRSYLKGEMILIDPQSRLRALIHYGFNPKAVNEFEGIITPYEKSLEETEKLIKENNKLVEKKQKKLGEIFFGDIKKKVKKFTIENFQKAIEKNKNQDWRILSEIKGSWLDELKIDGKETWNSNVERWRYHVMKDPLPSDFRFREDILWIREKDIPMAQKWKLALELQIRIERKTREKLNKKREKKKK